MIRRPPRSTLSSSSAASDVYKRQVKILISTGPGVGWIQDLRRHSLALNRHFEAENRIFLVRHVKKRPAERGVQQRAGVMDADALANTKGSAGPARVDQPHMRAMFLDLLLQQFGVGQRMMHHERPAEAGTESHLRFHAKPDFGAGNLAGIAGNEMVDGLVRTEFRDRRH